MHGSSSPTTINYIVFFPATLPLHKYTSQQHTLHCPSQLKNGHLKRFLLIVATVCTTLKFAVPLLWTIASTMSFLFYGPGRRWSSSPIGGLMSENGENDKHSGPRSFTTSENYIKDIFSHFTSFFFLQLTPNATSSHLLQERMLWTISEWGPRPGTWWWGDQVSDLCSFFLVPSLVLRVFNEISESSPGY